MVVSALDSARTTPPSSFPPKAEGLETSAVAPASDGSQQNARYFSPFIQFDHELGLAIIQYRDAETGAVIRQVPSKQAVDEYRARSSGLSLSGSETSDRTPGGSPGSSASSEDSASGASNGPSGSAPATGTAATGSNQTISADTPTGGGAGERSVLA